MGAGILGITWSCQKDIIELENEKPTFEQPISMTKLGKKLENPYAVTNMRKAWKNLQKANSRNRVNGDEITVTTTHLYIKFNPLNEEELDILKDDTTLVLYDYPLDYEIAEGGEFYQDPDVPSDQPTPQYCAVPVDHSLPTGVEYEVLEELFIPDDYSDAAASGRLASKRVVEALMNEALTITGNLEEASERGKTKCFFNCQPKWRPAGRIRVWSDGKVIVPRRVFSHWEYYECNIAFSNGIKNGPEEEPDGALPCKRPVYRNVYDTVAGGYIGLQGVEVRARRWFTTHKGFTNSKGDYSCNGEFRRDANYSIKWERYQFLVRDKWLSAAKMDGPKKTGDWDLDIKNGAQEYYATIFRAAHHYYYGYIKGLRRPPQNGLFKTQMKIRAYNESNGENSGNHREERRFLGLGSQIKVWNPQHMSTAIYATTIHELAHASHWDLKRSDFDDSERIVKESWARGVQWELTRMIYSGYSPSYSRLRYTGVVQDMIDGSKDTTSMYHFTDSNPWVYSQKSYSDKVSGYSIRQIEDALAGQKTWNDWRDNIKNKYNNGTKNNLDAIFNHWNTK